MLGFAPRDDDWCFGLKLVGVHVVGSGLLRLVDLAGVFGIG